MAIRRIVEAHCDADKCIDEHKQFKDIDHAITLGVDKIFHLECLNEMKATEFIRHHLGEDIRDLLSVKEGKFEDVAKSVS